MTAIAIQPTPKPRRRAPEPLVDLAALPGTAYIMRSQLARMIGFEVQTLKNWSRRGQGPRVCRIEGRPRYLVADVRSWLASSGQADDG